MLSLSPRISQAPVVFIGMQEHPEGRHFALFNTIEGHTLSEDGLRKYGLHVPPAEISADLLGLALRHYGFADVAERAGDMAKAERLLHNAHVIAEGRWS